MGDRKNEDNMISRRQMLGYCLAGAAGFMLWQLRRYSSFMPGEKNESISDDPKRNDEDTESLTEQFKSEMMEQGADLVGIGDLTGLTGNGRDRLPVGICLAVKFPKDIVKGIVDLPTREYYDAYNTLNSRLYTLTDYAIKLLEEWGYHATSRTNLPHKTIATRSGIGWVGKSNLLVTEKYGSMIRLASVLTDAPLKTDAPVNESKCGDCMLCVDACPAGALTGKQWDTSVRRDDILDTSSCSSMAIKRSIKGFGIPIELCGKCFAVCKYTKQYIKSERKEG